MLRYVCFLMAATLFLAGCIRPPSAESYDRTQMGRAATVMEGVVVDVTQVKVSGTNSGVGSTSGAIAGGAAGSAVGDGARTNIIGAVGGAVAGGILGSVSEQAITEGKAKRYIVKQKNGQTIAVVQADEKNLHPGDNVFVLRAERVRIVPADNLENKGNQG